MRELARKSWAAMIKDPAVKMRYAMRRRLTMQLKQAMKTKCASSARVVSFLGCSVDEFKRYLEFQFTDGMTWDNHGKVWHIDHVFPLASVDPTDEEALKKAWHYTNMRPLLAKENLRKRDSIPLPYQPILAGL